MSIVVNLLRSVLFFSLCGFGFHSMSADGTFRLPLEAIEKHRLATQPITSPRTAGFIVESLQNNEKFVIIASTAKVVTRSIASMYDPVESMKEKETLVARELFTKKSPELITPVKQSSDICSAAKSNKGLSFNSPTSYLSSVLKKAGAVEKSKPLFNDHADLIWDKYLSKNNFEDVSEDFNDGEFEFEKLKNGSLIVLEKSCFKEGTAAVYCDGKYYTTKFVKTNSLVKKINSNKSNCQLGKGMRIVVEKSSPASLKTKTLASAY